MEILDLASGYYQLEIEADSRRYTAFSTISGHYQFKKMPFGLVNAPFAFNRTMEDALKKLPSGTFKRYMDDIITGGKTVSEVIEKLRLLFSALEDAGLTLKTSKCFIGYDEIDFLGYRLSDKGLQPGLSKVDAIVNFPTPKTPRQAISRDAYRVTLN
ncbi:Pol polyprotein-like protein [Leptotrombidium deliense]|uniref:Pol polyprotein-like protein n=1 Tax=Leptotrombidium deliense TaxID=299467 RepID=A0A443RU37_9ACAR|nr:Pol polyprotein-like protein [Leptotrombidium deliense]